MSLDALGVPPVLKTLNNASISTKTITQKRMFFELPKRLSPALFWRPAPTVNKSSFT